MDLKDCLTFPKYEKFPPTYVLRYHGINPVVSLLKDKPQEWTGHSTLISENLKLLEISKNNVNSI